LPSNYFKCIIFLGNDILKIALPYYQHLKCYLYQEKRMKKGLVFLLTIFALQLSGMTYAEEATESTATELPEGVAPLPDFVPAE
jgi:hypothetical protein